MSLTFAPAVYVHPDRHGVTRSGRLRLIVLHTTEGGEGDTRPEQLAAAVGQPATRDAKGAIINQASYHYVADTDQRVVPLVPEGMVAYSAPGANNDGIHIVNCGRADQTTAQWLDPFSFACIVATALLMQDISRRLGIPLRRLTVAEVLAGQSGYCDHHTITLAYKRSTHTDVGPNYPWATLDTLLHPQAPYQPPTEEEMQLIQVNDDAAVLLMDGTVCTSVADEATMQALIDDGIVARTAPRRVQRKSLGALELHGPPPSYDGYTGEQPGRTVAQDFRTAVK